MNTVPALHFARYCSKIVSTAAACCRCEIRNLCRGSLGKYSTRSKLPRRGEGLELNPSR
jgi:hypothetical protein